MAILELHGPGGSPQTFNLPRSGSLLIGSDAVCDIQIMDGEVQPIHARLKVAGDKVVIEATPEGKSFKHNGRRVAQAAINPGDEMGFGGFRLLLSEAQARSAPAAPVAQPPKAQPKPAAAPAQPAAAKKAPPLELDWDDIAEVPAAKPVAAKAAPAKGVSAAKPVEKTSAKAAAEVAPVTVAADSARGLTVFAEEEETGRKLAGAPKIILLSVTLIFLVIVAAGLWWIIDRTRANRAFAAGVAAYEANDFKTSSEQLRTFLRMRPAEDRSSRARVLETLARVRDLSEGQTPQLAAALKLAGDELTKLGEEPAWKDQQMNAAEVVAAMTRDLASRARQSANTESVEQARSAYRLHQDLAGEAAPAQRARLKVDQIMAEAEAAVAKGEMKNRTLVKMDDALKSKDALAAFQARDLLLASYPDLISDTGLSRRLDQANTQVRENVKPLKISRDAVRDDPAQPLGPPLTVFSRQTGADNSASPPLDVKSIVVESGAGLAVGLDQKTGRPVWQVPAGMQQGFDPLILVEESPPSVIRYDDRDQSIVRTEIETGKTIWRQPLGDTPSQQPLVLGNRLITILPAKGHVLWLDLATGALRDGLDLQLPLAGSLLVSQNNQTLYVPGDQSVLFVLQVEPKSCLRSVYVGHKKGTLKARPARSGRFLLFPEQVGLRAGNLQTWLIDDRTGIPQRLQQEPLEGWPVFGPAQQGNLLWVSHDRGGFGIYSIGDYTLAKPLASVGKSPATTAPAHPTSTIAIGQREALMVDRTLKHYRLDPQSGRLSVMRSWELPEGYPVQPIQKLDDNTYLVTLSIHRDLGRAIVAVDIREDKPVWSTSWGMPVELAEERIAAGALRWVDPAGASYEMKLQPAVPGGIYAWPTPKKEPGAETETGPTWVWHNAGSARIGLSEQFPNRISIRRTGSSEVQELKLPVETGIPTLLLDDMLVIAGLGGEVAIASARDGTPVGQPFVPDYEKTSPWKWQAMVGLEDKSIILADDSGRLIRLVVEGMPAKLRQTSRVTLEGKFSGTLVSTGRAVLALMSGGSVVSLAGRDLSTQSTWTFPGAGTRLYPLGSAKALLCHPSGLIRLVDESGQTQVETKMPGAMPAGRPIFEAKELAWLGQNKESELITWKIDEPEPRRMALGTWVQGPVFRGESGWLVIERPGLVRQVGSATTETEKKP